MLELDITEREIAIRFRYDVGEGIFHKLAVANAPRFLGVDAMALDVAGTPVAASISHNAHRHLLPPLPLFLPQRRGLHSQSQ